jgi:hypothetical protein
VRSTTPRTEELDIGWEDDDPHEAVITVGETELTGGEAALAEGEAALTADEPLSGEMEAAPGDADISVGESDVSLDDISVEFGDDPYPSPFERITVVPPLPEREYVAKLMGELPESERVPSTRPYRTRPTPRPSLPRRSPTPAGTKVDSSILPPSPDTVSSRPTHVDELGPLTLDLADSVRPAATSEVEQTGVRERSAFPAAPPVAPPASDAPALSFGPTSGGALELVGARAEEVKPTGSPSITLRAVRDRFDVGDFSGALVLAEGILEQDPESPDALLYAEHCREVLKQMYISRLGGVRRVPQVVVSPEQLRWLSLDHRAGFLLSLVDGRSSLDEVLDMSGMPDLEALRVLMQLLQQNVIKVL